MSDLAAISRRLLEGEDRSESSDAALRRWFESAGQLPPAALAADSPKKLLDTCGDFLRPRAIELCELLAPRAKGEGRRLSRLLRLWVVLDRGGGGIALRLSAWRVDGPAGLAADPHRHATAARDRDYRQAEAAASRILETRHPGLAVRYSLSHADGTPYMDPIGDGSLGAALAVAALAVAVGRSPFTLDSRGAITGAVTSDGRIGSVHQGGLSGKALAARRAGARRLVVPSGQADRLPGTADLQVREATTVEEARRRLRILRSSAKMSLLVLLAATFVGGLAVHQERSAEQHDRQRELAAERAMSKALSMVGSDPRTALQLSAAAAQIDPARTAPARSLLAVALPPDIRFLRDLPAPATAISWTSAGIVAATRTRLYKLSPGHTRWMPGQALPVHRTLAFCGSGRLVLGSRKGAFLFDQGTGRLTRVTSEPVREVAGGGDTAAVLTRAGGVIAVAGGPPERIRVAAATDTVPIKHIVQVAVSADGRLLAADDLGRILRLQGTELVLKRDFPISPAPVKLTALAAAGKEVVAGSHRDPYLRSVIGEVVGKVGSPVAAVFPLPPERGIAIRGDQAEVFVADGNYLTLRTEQQLVGRFRTAAVSPDGRELIVAGKQAALLRLDRSLPSPLFFTQTVTFGRHEEPLALATGFGGVLRLRRGAPSVLIPGIKHGGELSIATVSPNGRWAVQVEPKARLRLFDLWSHRVRTFRANHATYDSRIEHFYVYPGVLNDGRVTLSEDLQDNGKFEGTTYVVDPTEERAERLDYLAAGPFARELPPGRLLLARGEHVDLVRLRDMTMVARATVPGAFVNTLTATASGRRVFFGTSAGDVWAWTPVDGSRPQRLGQVDGVLNSLVSNRNGSVLFGTASHGLRSSSVFALSVPDERVTELEAPEDGSVSRAALSPDQQMVAFSASNPVGAELLTARLTPRQACARSGGEISDSVWRRAIGGLPVAVPSCPGD